MLGAVRGNFFVGCIVRAAAGVADDRFDNALGIIVRRLHAPKAAAGKNGLPRIGDCRLRGIRDHCHEGQERNN